MTRTATEPKKEVTKMAPEMADLLAALALAEDLVEMAAVTTGRRKRMMTTGSMLDRRSQRKRKRSRRGRKRKRRSRKMTKQRVVPQILLLTSTTTMPEME